MWKHLVTFWTAPKIVTVASNHATVYDQLPENTPTTVGRNVSELGGIGMTT